MDRELFRSTADNCGSDKGSGHGYHRFYPLFLSQVARDEKFTIVEIGYGKGASIEMWRRLFPQAFVVCLDRDVSTEGDGYKVLKVDQGDPTALEAAIAEIPGPVRLIVDDGSHHPGHQLASFSILFANLLEPGGFYAVEDIETSYWLCGELYGYKLRYGLFNRWSAVEALKLAVDHLNRRYLSTEDRNLIEYSLMLAGLSPEASGQIGMLSFGQNCVVASKMQTEDQAFQNLPYAYAHCTARAT